MPGGWRSEIAAWPEPGVGALVLRLHNADTHPKRKRPDPS